MNLAKTLWERDSRPQKFADNDIEIWESFHRGRWLHWPFALRDGHLVRHLVRVLSIRPNEERETHLRRASRPKLLDSFLALVCVEFMFYF